MRNTEIDQSRHKVTEDMTEKTKMSFLLLSFVFTIILSYKIRDKTILHVDSHLLKELVQLCPIEVKEIKVQRCMIFHNSLFTCFNKCMMSLQVEPATERTILNRLKQTKFSPPTATRPTLAPSDTHVSKKKSPIFDFHARKIYVIVFALMVTEEMFFLYIYNILHVYDIALEKNEKEVLTTYAVMIFVSSSDSNITMYISS